MKKKLFYAIFLLFFFLISPISAQSQYQQGYYIINSGNKIECLIKNEDWKNSPQLIKIKMDDQGDVEEIDMRLIKEFAIDSESKYIKRTLDIDFSSDKVNALSYTRNPEWKKQTVFLKVLIEGAASLYQYESGGFKRYFYATNGQPIKQLLYKRYHSNMGEVQENNDYKQELLNTLKLCETIERKDFVNLNYSKKSLSKLFNIYNICTNNLVSDYTKNSKKVDFNFNIKAGLHSSTVSIQNRDGGYLYDFETSNVYRVVLEAELILPFNNNKWAGFIWFAKNGNIDENTKDELAYLSYKYFEITFGARHYMFINDANKLSLYLGYTFDVPSELKLERNDSNSEPIIDSDAVSGSFIFGAGYHYKQWQIEAGFVFNRQVVVANTARYISDYNSINLTLGYNLF